MSQNKSKPQREEDKELNMSSKEKGPYEPEKEQPKLKEKLLFRCPN